MEPRVTTESFTIKPVLPEQCMLWHSCYFKISNDTKPDTSKATMLILGYCRQVIKHEAGKSNMNYHHIGTVIFKYWFDLKFYINHKIQVQDQLGAFIINKQITTIQNKAAQLSFKFLPFSQRKGKKQAVATTTDNHNDQNKTPKRVNVRQIVMQMPGHTKDNRYAFDCGIIGIKNGYVDKCINLLRRNNEYYSDQYTIVTKLLHDIVSRRFNANMNVIQVFCFRCVCSENDCKIEYHSLYRNIFLRKQVGNYTFKNNKNTKNSKNVKYLIDFNDLIQLNLDKDKNNKKKLDNQYCFVNLYKNGVLITRESSKIELNAGIQYYPFFGSYNSQNKYKIEIDFNLLVPKT